MYIHVYTVCMMYIYIYIYVYIYIYEHICRMLGHAEYRNKQAYLERRCFLKGPDGSLMMKLSEIIS